MRPVVDRLQAAAGLTDIGVASLRSLTTTLRPPILDHLGLVPAIRWEASIFSNRTGIRCHVRARPASFDLDDAHVTALYRILLSALENIARHAAAGTTWIYLTRQRGLTLMEIRDNGRGITEEQVNNPRTMGLLAMRERALALGGEVRITGARGRARACGDPARRAAAEASAQRPGGSRPDACVASCWSTIIRWSGRASPACSPRRFPDCASAKPSAAQSALEHSAVAACHLILLDLTLPGDNGLTLLRRLRREFPAIPVLIVIDAFGRPVRAAGAAGRRGRLPDQGGRSRRARARRPQRARPAAATSRPSCRKRRAGRGPAQHDVLSDREYQVLRMIGAGAPSPNQHRARPEREDHRVPTARGFSTSCSSAPSAELIHYAVVNRLGAESRPRNQKAADHAEYAGSEGRGFTWNTLSGVVRVLRGPCNPRVPAAALLAGGHRRQELARCSWSCPSSRAAAPCLRRGTAA